MSRPIWGAIQVQLLTGMRPGEVLAMRGCDLNMSGSVWEYRVQGHKTEHHGKERIVFIGPRAQAVLREFLRTDLEAPLFSPRDGRADYLRQFDGPGRPKKKGTDRRAPAAAYSPITYHVAIRRACERAFGMPEYLRTIDRDLPTEVQEKLRSEAAAWRATNCWHPHRLRHSAATTLRREAGLETARCVLGHSSTPMTELYAEADLNRARDIMAKVG